MNASRTRFGAPWGRVVRILSLAAVAILGGLPVMALTAFEMPAIARYSLVITPVLTLLVSAAFVVRGYELAPGMLIVQRLGWATRIPLAGLKTAVIDPEAMASSVRIFGNGGLFVISGLFRNNALGMYRAYVTDLRLAIVMRWADRTIVISPDAPEAFLEQLRAQGLLAPSIKA